ARKDGNTTNLINVVFRELRKEKIETELIELAGNNIQSCFACGKCFENKDKKCIIENDILNDLVNKMVAADAIILGSPTYFANVSSGMKAVIDRAGSVGLANNFLYKKKIGAAIVTARRSGSTNAFDAMNRFFLYQQMIIPGSSSWNEGFGSQPGDVNNDVEGIGTMNVLGQNMAWLMNKIFNNLLGAALLRRPEIHLKTM
ncbi:MAG: flavodoxin family protein, partial [Desulfatitalea sp.]